MQNSKIAWCDHTFNPWIGCTQIAEGCKNCYAKRLNDRFHYVPEWNGARKLMSDAYWMQPYTWNEQAKKESRPKLVFAGSMCDIWDNAVPSQWQNLLQDRILGTPNLIWLLLTKRPENIAFNPPFWWDAFDGRGSEHPAVQKRVWLGISASTQKEFDERAEALIWDPDVTPPRRLEKWPCKKFLSLEPLIEPVNIEKYLQERTITFKAISTTVKLPRVFDWVIVGGETGPGARPIHRAWVTEIIRSCNKYNVPLFFKQWGKNYLPSDMKINNPHEVCGKIYQEFPAEFGR